MINRPEPPYGRQGQAGLGKDTVIRVHFGVFSTSHFAPTTLRLYLSNDQMGLPTDYGRGGGAGIDKNVTHTFLSLTGVPTDLFDV